MSPVSILRTFTGHEASPGFIVIGQMLLSLSYSQSFCLWSHVQHHSDWAHRRCRASGRGL